MDNTITLIYDPTLNEDLNAPEVGGMFAKIRPDSDFALGSQIRGNLSSMGKGYSVNVVDYGSDLWIGVTYCNIVTGKQASLNFLIKIADKDGHGIVKTGSTKYRTFSSPSQATSYIRGVASSLASQTSGHY